MLIGIFTALLLYYSSHHATAVAPDFDQAEHHIKKDVHDETRRRQALEIIDKMKTETKSYLKQRAESVKLLDKAVTRRDVTAPELHAVADPLVAEVAATRDKLLDLRFQLKQVLSAEEWALVYPAPN